MMLALRAALCFWYERKHGLTQTEFRRQANEVEKQMRDALKSHAEEEKSRWMKVYEEMKA